MQERIIPKNVFQGKRVLGFHKRNLIEGIIAALIFYLVVHALPFVALVRRVLALCIGIFLIIINGMGIKGQPFSLAFIHYLKYRKMLKTYSYRTLDKAPNETEEIFDYDDNGQQIVKTNKSRIEKARLFFGC